MNPDLTDTSAFIRHCINNARANPCETANDTTDRTVYTFYADEDYDSLNEYLDNSVHQLSSNAGPNDTASIHSCPSLSDYDDDSHSEDDSTCDDDTRLTNTLHAIGKDSEDNATIFSCNTATTEKTESSKAPMSLADELPKSFLQLTGITVANFNMGCNFRIEKAISIMIHYDLKILAVQEHTPWNKKLSEIEIASISRHCDHWGFFATISTLQIVIIDKQLLACHRDTTAYEDGRVIKCRFEIDRDKYVTFIPVYGVAHSSSTRNRTDNTAIDEASRLDTMTAVRDQVASLISKASETADLMYVFGDLQDTPDQSRLFHQGSCRIPRHPLGIVNTCESLGLICTVYQHLHTLETPIITRHGSKGGRFIDGMYACPSSIPYVLGMQIIADSSIHSDHDLVVHKIDLGIKQFQVSKEKEERFDFRKIMNIPVQLRPGDDHPSLSTTVFKGADFRTHEQLYKDLQAVVTDPASQFLPRLSDMHSKLKNYEAAIIERTKQSITSEDQACGRLVQRTPEDAEFINATSTAFFTLLNDICREANLASNVPIIKPPPKAAKRRDVICENVMPGVTSVAIGKQIEDTLKRARSTHQRLGILISDITTQQRISDDHSSKRKATIKTTKSLRRFIKQQAPFLDSIEKTNNICQEVFDERSNHIKSIELARNRKIFDSQNSYQAHVIDTQGREEYTKFIHSMKQEIFGHTRVKSLEAEAEQRMSNNARLHSQATQWNNMLKHLPYDDQISNVSSLQIKKWLVVAKQARRKLGKMLSTIRAIRRDDFANAKLYYIRLGQYGAIARMVNPKPRTGPTAGSFYPTKPDEPVRRAINDYERQEACIQTHEVWMDNPPGSKNCHFLDLESDAVGPHGVSVHPDRIFDDEAQWQYLEGCLHEKVGQETSDRIQKAHERLPELFKHIQTESRIFYPFKYDCLTGEYLCPDLEANLRKNVSAGNGKARNTGFATPVLGRLPKIFLDVYLLKCKIQMALRLLDLGTECSLRICIGKPCGGVRPLTVGHDDNVFLNGIAQQAIQKEIARIGLLPETLCSYQKGKGCCDATILDSVIKEVAIQDPTFYLGVLEDDAEKMFDRLHLELQLVLLMLAGAGVQGFTEWQSANMCNRTNKLVTDIFIALLKYKCGLPQGSGFSVEIANLYAMFLLMWWNMDPIDPHGTIAPFDTPRHGFPLIAGGMVKAIASLAYVDDAKRYVALSRSLYSLEEFFNVVQGYCDLLADLSLGIKMGRNVRKCVLYLYNIPEHAVIPEFTSIAWSFEAGGPVKGSIAVVVMRRDQDNNLICYDVPSNLRASAPAHVKAILNTTKYLGVYNNAQLDNTEGKEKILKKLSQRIGLIATKTQTIRETQIAHNMQVCQVATFSPICINMSLAECSKVDRQLLQAYQYRLKYMPSDSKHNIFLSEKLGGIGVRSFTQEYVGALLRDVEVYISNADSLPAHALINSIEEATKLQLWFLHKELKLPPNSAAASRAASIAVSGKKILSYYTDWESPSFTTISYDHTHLMEKAIGTTCKLGFMLRDLNNEFISRFADELLLQDRHALPLGSPFIKTRAKLGAHIGDGNKNFSKYSMLGRVTLLLQVLFEEVISAVSIEDTVSKNAEILRVLANRDTYRQYKLFPKEISDLNLAATARSTIEKFQSDYRICSFYHLKEWRCYKYAFSSLFIQRPRSQDYTTIISDHNVFDPIVTSSMQSNSESLSAHLTTILRLKPDINATDATEANDPEENYPLSDLEILEYATQHDLPVFVCIDGSLSDDGIATVSVSLVAPDIQPKDLATEWEHRLAKILLTRSWRLPEHWGTGLTCINMAEALGFIIGEYTIPPEFPIIYITDSNNARTLQRNVRNRDSFTHRKLIRCVKQGIDHPIANHLEFLTSKWRHVDQLSPAMKRLYKRGEDICKLWASKDLLPFSQKTQATMMPYADDTPDLLHDHHHPPRPQWDDDSATNTSCSTEDPRLAPSQPTNSRYRFDHSMYDLLDPKVVIKVFSHQLNEDFTVKNVGNMPKPNLFVVSANQIADNAATQAHRLNTTSAPSTTKVYYPAFSPRWSFTFDGCITNKGATKVLHKKVDEELCLRKQHREKQGLFHRLFAFNGLKADHIGDETLLRNIMKQTAACWTRSLYRHPPLVKQVYDQWWFDQSEDFKLNNPEMENLDLKHWKKTTYVRELIIKRCPFCPPFKNMDEIRSGNLEHLHLYCRNAHLVKTRSYCHEKIEDAIHALYNFASLHERNLTFKENICTSTLQEKLETTALDVEKQERPILQEAQIIMQARSTNKAILLRNALNFAILTHQVPATKLLEFNQFPLSFRLGFIHSLPEKEFDLGSATVTDIGYTGIFPKPLLKILHQYARELDNAKADSTAFLRLVDNLVTAFVYRPLTVQHTIHLLLADVKSLYTQMEQRRLNHPGIRTYTTNPTSHIENPELTQTQESTPSRICYAAKCRLLSAKGILRHPMVCSNNRTTCSGCLHENLRHRKVERLENELLEDMSANTLLAPILNYVQRPITLKAFRGLFQHLPSMHVHKRDDHIYGAARYLANSFGIIISDMNADDSLDPLLTPSATNEIWRQAKFHCQCDPSGRQQQEIGKRAFCSTCSYLIFHEEANPLETLCRSCSTNEAWQTNMNPCLACQLATIVYRCPFRQRFTKQLDYWLSNEDTDSARETASPPTPRMSCATTTPLSNHDMLLRRTRAIEQSYSDIKSRGSVEQTRYVFENLSLLRNDIHSNCSNLKRDFTSHTSNSLASELTDENLSPRKRGSLNRQLFNEQPRSMKLISRPPLLPIDMNSIPDSTISTMLDPSKGKEDMMHNDEVRRTVKQARTLRKKKEKAIRKT